MQWLSKLMPRQKMQDVGDGGVQVGSVGGDLTHSQKTMNQTIYNTFYVMSSDSPAAPAANESRPVPLMATPSVAAEKKAATPEQLEVLRIMRLSTEAKECAEAFMQKHFKTIRVKRLNDLECRRTKGWVEACLKNEAAKRA